MARHGRRNIGLAGAAALLALTLPTAAPASFPGTNGKLVYETPDAPPSLRSVCPDGTADTFLRESAAMPAPSPDGSRIAYLYAGADPQMLGVWVIDADGTDAVQMTGLPTPAGFRMDGPPSWSPDGSKLTFNRLVDLPLPAGPREQPVVQDVATGAITPLLTDPAFGDTAGPNAWSPDGRHILFSNRATGEDGFDLWKVPAAGGEPERLLGSGDTHSYQDADFHPDGSRFVLRREIVGAATSENWLYDADGTGGRFFSRGANGNEDGDENVRFGPGGTKVALTHVAGGTPTVASADLDGSGIVDAERAGRNVRWSAGAGQCAGPPPGTMRLDEVLLAHGGRGARFVELRDSADETFPDEHAPYRVVVYDTAGARIDAHTISPALLQTRDNRQPLLIATPDASTLLRRTADERLRIALPTEGQACFTVGAGETQVSCVAWGCVTNPVAGVRPVPVPPDGRSLQRQGTGDVWHVARPTAKGDNRAGTTPQACRAGRADSSDAEPPFNPRPFALLPPGTSPELLLKVRRRIAVRGAAITFEAECRASGTPCAGRAVLRKAAGRKPRAAKLRQLGAASYSIAAGATKTVRIALSERAMRLLRRRHRLRATLSVTVTNARPFTRAVTLRAPPARPRPRPRRGTTTP